jgi:carboxypeptidase C (cathepsin A)
MIKVKIFYTILLVFLVNSSAKTKVTDQILHLPGLGTPVQKQFSGYSKGIFYWYVAAAHHPKTAPLIIWFSGGPGASSLYGFFLENGPYSVLNNGHLIPRKLAWSQFANYLVFDQPLGIGLSFTDKKQYPKSPEEGNYQLYKSLVAFLKKHPLHNNSKVYLSGESYGATYIALLAKKILKDNKIKNKKIIPLKGLIVISAWIDPIAQESQNTNFAYFHGLINKAQKKQLDIRYTHCLNYLKKHSKIDKKMNVDCEKQEELIHKFTNLNLHNIGLKNKINDTSYVTYLNRKEVRLAIHAHTTGHYKVMKNIWDNYAAHMQQSYLSTYANLLKNNIKIVVFSGLNDASDCNPLGTEAWISHLKWSGAKKFWKRNSKIWKVHNKVLGFIQNGENFEWVKVLNAGHMVPIDQPSIAILVKKFVSE